MKQFYNYTPRLLFHYENVVRPDLLLKCNYKNIMEVPFLREIKITSHTKVPGFEAQERLAIEILSGACCRRVNTNKSTLMKQKYQSFKRRKDFLSRQIDGNHDVQTVSIQGKLMYLFLDKIMTIVSLPYSVPIGAQQEASVPIWRFLSSAPIGQEGTGATKGRQRSPREPDSIKACQTKINGDLERHSGHGFIHIRLKFSELYLLPEVAWHSSLFESISAIDLSIATSAKSLQETNLLWSGFMQKESSTHHV